jgi:hypothetical protein
LGAVPCANPFLTALHAVPMSVGRAARGKGVFHRRIKPLNGWTTVRAGRGKTFMTAVGHFASVFNIRCSVANGEQQA